MYVFLNENNSFSQCKSCFCSAQTSLIAKKLPYTGSQSAVQI
ncbi:hypothetical protein HMPREF9144_2303 [Prevotella pallens ATCC 700821]|uniref:Uncharacterized protein n=1 Tax=Prevotella pallens ATCC 700821 TaxID=997353 RepID=F9DKW1_9BACT|nr:hypothetical protein HMPREF9144_2303 [Prevotella pallens ATCC 700821]